MFDTKTVVVNTAVLELFKEACKHINLNRPQTVVCWRFKDNRTGDRATEDFKSYSVKSLINLSKLLSNNRALSFDFNRNDKP